jgi:glutamine amidotransferase
VKAPRVAILDYGSGNLHSVSRAIARVGGEPVVTGDGATVDGADALVIPGVGHFGHCMRAIVERGHDVTIRGFEASGRPMFGVCVGMQVLFEASDEDTAPGLGILPGRVRAIPDAVKVPHMGWNTVTWTRDHPYVRGLDGARFYFVHSFAPEPADSTLGITEYGAPFAAASSSGGTFATQFHPEKSAEAGLYVYENFVKALS